MFLTTMYLTFCNSIVTFNSFLPSVSKKYSRKIEDTQPEKILQNTFERLLHYTRPACLLKKSYVLVYTTKNWVELRELSTTSTQLSYPKKTRPIELEFAKK